MQFKNIFLFSIFLIIKSSLVFGDPLLLKCSSLKMSDRDWIGSTMFVKIDEEKKEVLTREPTEKRFDGWVLHKLTIVKPNAFIFKSCLSPNCTVDKNAYTIIDRDIGTLKYHMRLSENEKFIKFYEYECAKVKKAF